MKHLTVNEGYIRVLDSYRDMLCFGCTQGGSVRWIISTPHIANHEKAATRIAWVVMEFTELQCSTAFAITIFTVKNAVPALTRCFGMVEF